MQMLWQHNQLILHSLLVSSLQFSILYVISYNQLSLM
uniref:Uncharacterized protein n=1 Tax=Arundo donax TaxID=35708 RepID=A0A0A9H6S6_ARUDO